MKWNGATTTTNSIECLCRKTEDKRIESNRIEYMEVRQAGRQANRVYFDMI